MSLAAPEGEPAVGEAEMSPSLGPGVSARGGLISLCGALAAGLPSVSASKPPCSTRSERGGAHFPHTLRAVGLSVAKVGWESEGPGFFGLASERLCIPQQVHL